MTYKYVLGLKNKPHIQLSGLEKRLNRPETKELILRLQKAAITVPANVNGILPLDSKLGNGGSEYWENSRCWACFYNRLQNTLSHTCCCSSDSMEAIRKRLLGSQRVIVYFG